MVNAWSLLYDEIYGDSEMKKEKEEKKSKHWYDYDRNDANRENPFLKSEHFDEFENPLPPQEDKVYLEPGEAATDNIVSAEFPDYNVYAADTVPLEFFYGSQDTVWGTAGADTMNLGGVVGSQGIDSISLLDDVYPTLGYGNTASMSYEFPPEYQNLQTELKPQPDLEKSSYKKYEEDKGLKDLADYVISTYQGHYTNDGSNVQTLDLIHSVGDAESFCRSNAIKYLSRYDKKGQAKRDILKAMHYCLLLYYFSGNANDETPTRGYETF